MQLVQQMVMLCTVCDQNLAGHTGFKTDAVLFGWGMYSACPKCSAPPPGGDSYDPEWRKKVDCYHVENCSDCQRLVIYKTRCRKHVE